MVWGAVIIGRPIGPDMIRPFTISDFIDLQERCDLRLSVRNPIEVAYPSSLDNLDKHEYQEGVLVNIFGGDKTNKERFFKYVGGRLTFAAQVAEKMQKNQDYGKILNPWKSDFDPQKIVHEGIGAQGRGRVLTPYIEVLDIYPDDNFQEKYFKIASDLSLRTRDARIKNYKDAQVKKHLDDVKRLNYFQRPNCF